MQIGWSRIGLLKNSGSASIPKGSNATPLSPQSGRKTKDKQQRYLNNDK
jgi:hypothetical protein